jgi:hypothetical protein
LFRIRAVRTSTMGEKATDRNSCKIERGDKKVIYRQKK